MLALGIVRIQVAIVMSNVVNDTLRCSLKGRRRMTARPTPHLKLYHQTWNNVESANRHDG